MAINGKLNYEKVEEFDQKTTEELGFHYKEILRLIGENPDREGLERTPLRVAKAIQFLTQGYALDPKEILNSAKFRENYREMGLRHTRGILLFGKPGNGKSATIQQVVEMITNRGDVVFFAKDIRTLCEALKSVPVQARQGPSPSVASRMRGSPSTSMQLVE